jgi:hypothetical protein
MQRHVERAQVAIVDADQRRRQLQRAIELGGVVDFDEHVHAEADGARFQRREPRVVERRDDQQDRIRPQRARLDDLVFVDDEFLAQRRHRACGTRLDQELGRALE